MSANKEDLIGKVKVAADRLQARLNLLQRGMGVKPERMDSGTLQAILVRISNAAHQLQGAERLARPSTGTVSYDGGD